MTKGIWLTLLFVLNACAQSGASGPARNLTIESNDGGSAVTELGYGIAVNKGSTLHRRWYVINDPSCPVNLGVVGIKPVYKSDLKFKAVGDLTPKVDISAVEVIFVQFDIWGNRERNLSATEIRDLQGQPVLAQSYRAVDATVPRSPYSESILIQPTGTITPCRGMGSLEPFRA